MKKRIMLAIMSLVMVASLAACAEQKVVSVPADAEVSVSETNEAVETSTEASEETSVEASTEDAAPAEEEKAFAVGVVNENVYENAYLGFGCKLGENWTLLSEEQIKEYNQITTDTLGDEYAKQMEALDVAFDMMAINETTQLDNINVIMQKLSGVSLILTEESFIDISLSDPATKEALESTGYVNVEISKEKINFLGKEHVCLKSHASYQDYFELYQAIIPVKVSGHMGVVTISSFGEDNTQALADLFYVVE